MHSRAVFRAGQEGIGQGYNFKRGANFAINQSKFPIWIGGRGEGKCSDSPGAPPNLNTTQTHSVVYTAEYLRGLKTIIFSFEIITCWLINLL